MLITVAGISITEFKLPDKQRYEETTKKSVVIYTKIAKTEVLLKFGFETLKWTLSYHQVKSSQVKFIVFIFLAFVGKTQIVLQSAFTKLETPLRNINCSRLAATISPKLPGRETTEILQRRKW